MKDLKELIKLHKEWLVDNNRGTRLDLRNVDLSCADLKCANLSGAVLRYADLKCANLSGAVLRNVDLSDANLRYADLSGTDLSGADLSGANLSGTDLKCANLRNCIGNNKEIKSLQLGTYLVSYTKEILNIGCQSHSHSRWKSFSDCEILDMDGEKALEWWSLNKHIIFELIERE